MCIRDSFNAATAACFGIHADVCPPYIVDLGTEEQKQRWLPGIASGEKIIAIGMTCLLYTSRCV